MKNFFKSIVAFNLGLFARAVVHRYKPYIVMVTGSVGKTSTKDAVATVLAKRFFVRKSEKSFNSELGVPFTILGVENPWRNPFAWFRIIKNALVLLILPNHYPNMLVLETGADRPGDLARILRFAMPDMVVMTRLPEISVHVEAYTSPEAVQEEEFSPAYALRVEAPLIIPSDDSYALNNAMRTPARVISYGATDDATVRVSDVGFYEVEGKVAGMRANINAGSERGEIIIKDSIGATQILPIAAAVAAGFAIGIPFTEALQALKEYEPPPGRGRIFDGKNSSVIIDDSYNASPAAVEEALATLKTFPLPAGRHGMQGRRIAVLGDMLELGRYSVLEHERIAVLAGDSADIIAAVGIRARVFTTASKHIEVMSFCSSNEAARALQSLVREGDVILVKGSQSIRMEHIVEALLANPSDVAHLVRQEKKWKEKV